MALRRILADPQFVFRFERDPASARADTTYRISDLELASRLSFFLWSSIPDDELLDVAAQGKLHDHAVLEHQVRRMLADPRADSLVSNFADQWLYLRNLRGVNPDLEAFPNFDDNLRQAFKRETELFFGSIIHEDRSVIDLLNADYTFVNERLAKHYGIPNVYGSQFRRVSWPDDSPRRGLLGQGSILTVTSIATRTSPVQRGKWLLENVLGTPPNPPPANVPPLKENKTGDKQLSVRERMEAHRASPACAGCHKILDPLGFALENFDAVGQWRTVERIGRQDRRLGRARRRHQSLGVADLRNALLSRPNVFAGTMTEKLMTYALGRGLEYYDMPAVRAVTHEAARNNYRFSSLILGIVESTPFQMRRSQEPRLCACNICSRHQEAEPAMIITKKHLPRRTFLRGVMGSAVALPLLDSMVPALTAATKTAASPKTRLGFIYVPHGAVMDKWTPATEGAGFEFTPILKPLEPFRDQLLVVTGLANKAAESQGDGGGDHARSAPSYLSGVHPLRTEGEDIRAGTTIDQIAAQKIGQDTPLPSLELGTEDTGLVGVCDVGYSCAYMNSISWRTPTQPLPMEINPRVVFERLFGDGSNAADRLARKQEDRSILDSITGEVAHLQTGLGTRDRGKISDYLDNIREIERRIQMAEKRAEFECECARNSHRRSRFVRRTRQADVRAAGAGVIRPRSPAFRRSWSPAT